ncbi:hypothetical protein [Psychrobacillus sp. NPDC096389]|uniref:hypothetical protein n=1 Tax=Psychrobacillus sp. NPDC096389 TaxID=3364490 RepID=UPI00380F4890
MKIRKRLPDGSFGPLEEVFPESIDSTILILLEAMAGMQEQIDKLTAKLDNEGGVE